MANTALITHPDLVLHDTGPYHPESADRLKTIQTLIEATDWKGRLQWIQGGPAETEVLALVHTREHIAFVEEACQAGRDILDRGDTRVSPETARVARLAAGCVVAGVDAVLRSGFRNSFCLVRPPGHHAKADCAMGFCVYNNAVIAARYAQKAYGLNRVLIVDWDVHHGNGTQDLVYDDPTIFFYSVHQSPCYPGTGALNEHGAGPGLGFTLNVPVSRGATIAEYRSAMKQLAAAAEAFKPELVVISAGFDAHREDPLGEVNLDDQDFEELTQSVCSIADKHCGSRVVSMLEGGYNTDALARAVVSHLRVLSR